MKKSKIFIFLLFLVCSLQLQSVSGRNIVFFGNKMIFKSASSFSLSGTVVDANNVPITNALVEGVAKEGNELFYYNTFSNIDGSFYLISDKTIYSLEVKVPGCDIWKTTSIHYDTKYFITINCSGSNYTKDISQTVVIGAISEINSSKINVTNLKVNGNGSIGGVAKLNARNKIIINNLLVQKGGELKLNIDPGIPDCWSSGTQGIIWDKVISGDGSIEREVRPNNFQLYPRDNNNEAKVKIAGHYCGLNRIYFRVTKTNINNQTYTYNYFRDLDEFYRFNFEFTVKAELSEYKFEYSTNSVNWNLIADRVVCGDAYLIFGQSWASANDLSEAEIVRLNNTYGGNSSYGKYSRSYGATEDLSSWGISSTNNYFHVGAFGLCLQYLIQEEHKIPTCIINGAEGGMSIPALMPKENEHYFHCSGCKNDYNSFMHFNSRVYLAGLENNIKSLIWWQADAGSPITKVGEYSLTFAPMYELWGEYFKDYGKAVMIQPHSYVYFPVDLIRSEDFRIMPERPDFDRVDVLASNGIGPFNSPPQNLPHFNAVSNEEVARRLFVYFSKLFYNSTLVNTTSPNIESIYLDGNQVNLVFNQTLDISKSDSPSDVLKLIRFNTGYNLSNMYNPVIVANVFRFSVYNLNFNAISYAGYIPDIDGNGQLDDHNFQGYLKNENGLAALSFYNFPVISNSMKSGNDISAISSPDNYTLKEKNRIDFIVYPNPNNGIFTIKVTNISSYYSLNIYSLNGEEITVFNHINGDSELNLSRVPAGLYIIRLISDNNVLTKRIIIDR